ncbi:hypothetical protein MKW92_032448, partial [Papaver armeniacum]
MRILLFETLRHHLTQVDTSRTKALVAKLHEGTGVNANNDIVNGVLVTVGELAGVGGFAMPLIVEALIDRSSVTKREVAVATLGQVVQSTGYVIEPYNAYPLLLGLLLKLLNCELAWSTRREVLNVLGTGLWVPWIPMFINGISKAFQGHMEKLSLQPVILASTSNQWMCYPRIFGHLLPHQRIIILR